MNENFIWNYLINKFNNPHGVAGLMGNLYAESSLNPKNLQSAYEKKLGYTDDSYTDAVDNNNYTNFIYDKAGYGIAQWTYWTRKQNLYNLAKKENKSIGDLNLQLDFLYKELQEYPSVFNILKNASSIEEACKIVLTDYERAADQSQTAIDKRANYALNYYNQFAQKGSDKMAIDYINSTGTHYISNSGSDENKNYYNGQAGDQTGHEWELKAWYNRPWSIILRYPDQRVALKIAELGIAAALNNKIGYDQYQRTTYWTQLKAANYDPSKITVACEEDCTAGVSSNVRAAGYIFGIKALQDIPICSSRNMRSEFTKAGFKGLTASKYLNGYKYLLPGDILLYDNHHAATNVTLGALVKDEWKPTVTSSAAIEQVTEGDYIMINGSVNIRKGPSTNYESLGVATVGSKLKYWDKTFDNGWFLVEYNGQLAAVSNKYATIIKG